MGEVELLWFDWKGIWMTTFGLCIDDDDKDEVCCCFEPEAALPLDISPPTPLSPTMLLVDVSWLPTEP